MFEAPSIWWPPYKISIGLIQTLTDSLDVASVMVMLAVVGRLGVFANSGLLRHAKRHA